MVKEFDQDPRADVWIFLDAEKKNHRRTEAGDRPIEQLAPMWRMRRKINLQLPPDSFEYAVTAAGSVADFYLKQSRGVGYASYGLLLTVLSAETGDRQHNRILDHLAFVRCEGKMDLMGLVQAQAPNLVRGSIVILITTSGYNEAPYLVDALLHRRMNPVVIAADLSSFGDESGQKMNHANIIQLGVPLFTIKKWDHDEANKELISPVLRVR